MLNKPLVLELARCEYIVARDNVIALGNSGTGKTHACLALGLAACQRGFSVAFFTAARLVHQLMEARDERGLLKLQTQLAAVKLLIVDELGYVPLSQTGAVSSKYSASVTNAARPSSRRIFPLRNGPPSSAASVSLARFSIASRIMSIFWS
jgi:DNA replication protein DnaC